MNTETLSQRLQAVVKYIPEGFKVADIGSDHAYLPCNVVKRGISPFAIAGEVVKGPFQSAVKQVKLEGLESQISVRMGNGLEVINTGEVDCITICGMGGTLISTILEAGKQKLHSVKRLILQPNVGSKAVRFWLYENGWSLIAEEILEEDGKIYEVLVAEQGDPKFGYNEDLDAGFLFGPYLMKNQSGPFKLKWQGELTNWLRILTQLEQGAANSEIENKKQEILMKINLVKGALNINEES
ncbi:tRNA (adenine-N(1))-methyltransferase [Bacillus sp. DNRA2]|uniref:tRNA (adenine(22)-N(1))-methyltransferase n=1 Tax=Bacillus sp. DNRA2 TaxID=2723053 RepID=UPI00145D8677|nr:class I SAM-dependent methyltransferase [Bacillus sp. DNRA2]NMD71878.1 tRNA (adenine-N(1))-methyltransferase [Bacillus sp. DNRA2]